MTIGKRDDIPGTAPHGARRTLAAIRGFTLLELITTIAIAAILMAIAVPNLTMFVENNRMKVTVGDVAAALNFARSEASKRRFPVTVCARASDTTCANSATWNSGLLVFADSDGNGTFDPGAPGNEILRVVDSLPDHVTLETRGFVTPGYLQYSSAGETNVSGRFRICNSRTGYDNIARSIDITPTGRANVDPNKYLCSAL